MDLSVFKLIIWDLDETLWCGVLSENTAEWNEQHAQLIRNMIDAGVMCSICSKNDEQDVKTYLESYGLWDLFVFNSINWSPKGDRVKQIVERMGLREPNVMFVDDNALNRREVAARCPRVTVCDVDIISELTSYFEQVEKKDTQHKRLQQYKVLEQKEQFKAESGSNEDFLVNCHIRVDIHEGGAVCLKELDRLSEIVLRTNQLNFTKVRSTKDELEKLFVDSSVRSGYVDVKDDFGDYGIVGFFAIRDNRLLHFAFSCRTLNMGVEQYVYHELGKPTLDIVGDVSSELTGEKPYWINQTATENPVKKEKRKSVGGHKVLIKGPCDMEQMFAFIQDSKNIITEFTFINDKGISIEHQNHTVQIIDSFSLPDETKKRLVDELPFGDPAMFKTAMFDSDMRFIVYSLFTDPNLGVYHEKSSGALIAFGEHMNDLTDESNWDRFINGEIFTAHCALSKSTLSISVYFRRNRW